MFRRFASNVFSSARRTFATVAVREGFKRRSVLAAGGTVLAAGWLSWFSSSSADQLGKVRDYTEENAKLVVQEAQLGWAPHCPPPIKRNYPVRLTVNMAAEVAILPVDDVHSYEFWTFNGSVPGPMIRAREGDLLDVNFTNKDMTGMLHNIDFHAVTGPGGGAGLLTADSDKCKRAEFKLLVPGLYIYHCAVGPVGVHEANGMFGLILVEPKEGLPPVDQEYYVVQHELYTTDTPADPKSGVLDFDEQKGMDENPSFVVFNGKVGSLKGDQALKAKAGDRVRLFFGNGGPNLVSSFHVIGAIFDKVWREGDFISPPARGLQTTLVPAGGACMVEFNTPVPGNLTLVDHSIFRIEKGAAGFLTVEGMPRPDLYHSDEAPRNCPACKHHAD